MTPLMRQIITSPQIIKPQSLGVDGSVYDDASPLKIVDTNDASIWTGITPVGDIATDTVIKYATRNTVKFVKNEAIDPYGKVAFDAIDLTSKDMIELVLYAPDWSVICGPLRVRFYTSDDDRYNRILTRARYFRPITGITMTGAGWMKLRIPKADFAVEAGTPDWANISAMWLQPGGEAAEMYQINIAEVNAVTPQKAVLFLDFDDGLYSVYQYALPIMKSYGLRGTSYVITSKIDTTTYMTMEQLKELDREGWCIGAHTHTHQQLSLLTDSQISEEYKTCQNILRRNGFIRGSLFLAAPGGAWSLSAHNIASNVFAMARPYISTGADYDNYPGYAGNNLRLHNFLSILNTDSAATLTGKVDDLILHGQMQHITFHGFDPAAPTTYTCTPTIFDAFCAYVAAKVAAGVLDVITPEDMYF